ncbi:MAG: YkvA family protein [Calditrichia bacterium]
MEENSRISKKFEQMQDAAGRLLNEQDKLRVTVEKTMAKVEKEKNKIHNFMDNIIILIQMIKSYLNREYTNLPWKSLLYSVAAVLYFLTPLDVIPDFIPALGFLDDATVIAFVVNSIKEDLDQYRQFRIMQKKADAEVYRGSEQV